MASEEPASVISVEVVRDFVLHLFLSDGSSRELDLEENLRGPVFEPLRMSR